MQQSAQAGDYSSRHKAAVKFQFHAHTTFKVWLTLILIEQSWLCGPWRKLQFKHS